MLKFQNKVNQKTRCFSKSLKFCISATLSSAFLLSATLSAAQARDCDTHSIIYPIEEEDPIQVIQQKLKVMEENGELERHHKELQQKTKAAVERPKSVEGITKAAKSRVFYYDPSYVVKEDLKDHTGRVFYKKGTKINPLETVSLSQPLLFFDGDDPEQKAWAENKLKEENVKLILVKGAPLGLSEEWHVPVYFDQGGLLTKKLGIQHVPAIVTQDLSQQSPKASLDNKLMTSLRLRIEEISVR